MNILTFYLDNDCVDDQGTEYCESMIPDPPKTPCESDVTLQANCKKSCGLCNDTGKDFNFMTWCPDNSL